MKDYLLEKIDWFIPDDFGSYNQSEVLLRARVLIGVLLSSIVLTVFMYFAAVTVSGFHNNSVFIGGGFAGITLAFFVVCLNLFKYTGSFLLTSNLLASSFYFSIFGSVFVTGGFGESPTVLLFLVIPPLVFPLAGAMSGLIWSFILFLSILFFYIAFKMGVELPQTILERHLKDHYVVMLAIVICFNTIGLYIGYLLQKNLSFRLYEERSQLEYDASHDPVTGISNQLTFDRRLKEKVDMAVLNDRFVVMLLIEMTNLNDIYHRHGKDARDAVLLAAAKRLQGEIRPADTVAHLSDSEFGLILLDLDEPIVMTNKCNEIIEKVCQPIRYREEEFVLTVISGMSCCPLDADEPEALSRVAMEKLLGEDMGFNASNTG